MVPLKPISIMPVTMRIGSGVMNVLRRKHLLLLSIELPASSRLKTPLLASEEDLEILSLHFHRQNASLVLVLLFIAELYSNVSLPVSFESF